MGIGSSYRRGRDDSTLLRVVITIVLLWCFVVAILNVMAEWQIRDLAQKNARSLVYFDPNAPFEILPEASGLSARAALSAATYLARNAARQSGSPRKELQEEAGAYLDYAQGQRMNWAQATLVRMYLGLIARPEDGRSVGMALARSYSQAPFLRSEGEWRVRKSIQYWDFLDHQTRRHSMEEAVYLSSLSYPMRVHMRLLIEHTQAQPMFEIAKQHI